MNMNKNMDKYREKNEGAKIDKSFLTETQMCYSPTEIKSLFSGEKVSPKLDMDFEKDFQSEWVMENMGRITISGVQEKLSAIIEDGYIKLTPPGKVGTHIIKPVPLDYDLIARKQIPANENLTMQIAKQVYDIPTAENGLCFDSKGRPVYITKRFDLLEDGTKVQVEDFATLLCRSEQSQTLGHYFKYEGCYEEIANAIKRVIPQWEKALLSFFRLLVFNYIYANGDAHLKNFSIISSGKGTKEYQLSPAYDLMNVSLHLNGDDFGLIGGLFLSGWKSDVYERTGHPCRTDFEEFGIHIGLHQDKVEAIVKDFLTLPDLVVELIGKSFLEKKMKRKYLAIVKERMSRFKRQSL